MTRVGRARVAEPDHQPRLHDESDSGVGWLGLRLLGGCLVLGRLGHGRLDAGLGLGLGQLGLGRFGALSAR